MKKRNSFRIIIGIIFLISAIIYQFSNPNYNPETTIIMSNVGFVFLLVGLVRHWRFRDEPEQDERTKMIAYTSLAASFQLTLLGLAIFWWVDYYAHLQISLQQFITGTILGMALLVILMRIYYNRKKEI